MTKKELKELIKECIIESLVPQSIPSNIDVETFIEEYIKKGSKGDLDLRKMQLTELPSILKNVEVGRNFYCSYNNLTSLTNSPRYIRGDFYCSYNHFTSLVGAPKYVGGDFICHNNPVKFTDQQVRDVCEVGGRVNKGGPLKI